MANIASLRDSADILLDQAKYESAFDIYDVVHNQIWFAIGNIQQGVSQFSNNFLNHNFSASIDFKRDYTSHASNAVFIKTLNGKCFLQ